MPGVNGFGCSIPFSIFFFIIGPFYKKHNPLPSAFNCPQPDVPVLILILISSSRRTRLRLRLRLRDGSCDHENLRVVPAKRPHPQCCTPESPSIPAVPP